MVVVHRLFGRVYILSTYLGRNVFLGKVVILKNSTNMCHDCKIIFTGVLLRVSQPSVSDLPVHTHHQFHGGKKTVRNNVFLVFGKERSLENGFLSNVWA
jgi:hypothetical protein